MIPVEFMYLAFWTPVASMPQERGLGMVECMYLAVWTTVASMPQDRGLFWGFP